MIISNVEKVFDEMVSWWLIDHPESSRKYFIGLSIYYYHQLEFLNKQQKQIFTYLLTINK